MSSTQNQKNSQGEETALAKQANKKYSTTWSEIADRTADIFFLTEIMGALWLCFKVALQPKVRAACIFVLLLPH